jgi:hypothetical protein
MSNITKAAGTGHESPTPKGVPATARRNDAANSCLSADDRLQTARRLGVVAAVGLGLALAASDASAVVTTFAVFRRLALHRTSS